MTDLTPRQEAIGEFALRHGLTEEEARKILERHGDDEDALSEAVRNLAHFLTAPS